MRKVFLFSLLSFTVFAQEKKFDEYNQKILGQDYNLVMIPLPKGEFFVGGNSWESLLESSWSLLGLRSDSGMLQGIKMSPRGLQNDPKVLQN